MSDDATLCIVVNDNEERSNIEGALASENFDLQFYSRGKSFLNDVKSRKLKCALVDLFLPDMSGIDILAALTRTECRFPVLITDTSTDDGLSVDVQKLGAAGFIARPFTRKKLVQAIEFAIGDRQNADRQDKKRADEENHIMQILTPREREVLALLANGYRNKMIAYELGISQRTVEVHRARLMRRLNVKTFADLIRLAFDHRSAL